MKVITVSLIAVAILIWFFWAPSKVSLVDSTSKSASPATLSAAAPMLTPATTSLKSVTEPTPIDKKHIDHLTPEMKEAVRDKLFHHGPKTTTKDEQGQIRLDAAGRYVNMPVAVRKADGSIEIKEYSVVPETHTEVTQ